MKKFLLITATLLAGASSAFALQEQFIDEDLTTLSPNGVWAAGAIQGDIFIRNLQTGKVYAYGGNASGTLYYALGNGTNNISNDGIVVGKVNDNSASWWKDGEWHALKVKNSTLTNTAHGITPDGSVICGNMGNQAMSLEATDIMSLPVVWYRNDDGTYGDPIVLPHPTKDFTNRLPQYVTATCISADGKIVAGQMTDYMGHVQEPIVYICDDNGEWSYRLIGRELIEVPDVKLPVFPGEWEGPLMPVEEQFMTQEEIDAFSRAFDAYLADNTGTVKQPTYEEFMTEEELDAYLKAYMEWYVPFSEWEEAYNSFDLKYAEYLDKAYIFEFNHVTLTPDGQYYGTTRSIVKIDPEYMELLTEHYPVIINVDGSGHTDLDEFYPELSILATYLAADGTLLGNSSDPYGVIPSRAYIFPEGKNKGMPLEEYIAGIDEELSFWMEDMMYHEAAYLDEEGKVQIGDFLCSGLPAATPDLSVFVCSTDTYTWETAEGDYYSWVFSVGDYGSGVKEVEGAPEYAVKVLADGVIVLTGDFASVNVYDISGAKVYGASNVTGTLRTNLRQGIYLVRTVAADGTEAVRKVAF